jgi:hypothetical protein
MSQGIHGRNLPGDSGIIKDKCARNKLAEILWALSGGAREFFADTNDIPQRGERNC